MSHRSNQRSRTRTQRDAWKTLSSSKRRLLLSHLPDEFESEMNLRSSIMTACSNVFGPFQWDAVVATLAEGEAEEIDRPKTSDHEPDGMSVREIANELEVSTGRVHEIMNRAFRRLHSRSIVHELRHGERPEEPRIMQPNDPVRYYADLVEAALERAKRTHTK